MDAESLSKLILDKVVNDLVKQKQSLPSGQLPRDTLTEVINSLREHNVHITHDALKQRVKRAYASARGPSTPLPPPPPATEVVTRGTATNTSPISQLTTPAASSTEGSSIATSSAQSTSTHPGPSATPYHTGGRPKGTTNANKKKQKDTLTDCRNAIAREYFNERKKSENTLKALPNNYLKNLIESKKVEYGIEGEVGINPKTIMRRYQRHAKDPERHQLESMHPGTSSPLHGVERIILQIIFGMQQVRQPMYKDEVITLMNEVIKGTRHEEEFREFKEKRLASGAVDDSGLLVGERWWQGFLQRHKAELESKKCERFASDRADWTRMETFIDMYNSIYAEMADAGVAVKLDTPIFTDRNGKEVPEDSPDKYGSKQEYKVVHPHLILFADETGCNTSQKKDGNVGGRKALVKRGTSAQQKVSTTDHPFTLLPFTCASGEAVVCVVIFKSESISEIPIDWAHGKDIFISPEEIVYRTGTDTIDVHANTGPGKYFPKGPVCNYDGKQVPTFYYASPGGGINADILVDILKQFDDGIVTRQEGVTPFLLIDGHQSRLDHTFLSYINNENHKWRVCLGVPYGTSLWQVGDSAEQNGAFKIYLTEAKEKLFREKSRQEMSQRLVQSDVMPLLNRSFHAFQDVDANRNAISERGWYPLSRALLDHPSLARPTTSEVTENDGTGSTTSATTTTTTTTAAGSRTVSININAGGQAARYLDTMLEEQRRNNRLDENVRRRRDGGTSARELLEKSRALTAGVVVATGNYSLNNKSLCEFVNDKHEKKMAEEARVLAYRKGKKRKQIQDVNDLRKTFGHESVHRFAQFNKDQCGKYLQYKKRKKDSKMPDDLEERRARCLEVMGRQSPVPSDDEEEQELIPPPNNNPNVHAVTNNSTEENNVEAEGDDIFGHADDNLEAVKDAAI